METLGNRKISVVNINKRFNGQIVLEDISFDIKEGEFVTIIGSNGSGKSTFFNTISGVFPPEEGHIFINNIVGCDFMDKNSARVVSCNGISANNNCYKI